MALGYAIIIGLGAVLGTLVPLFVQHRSATESTQGLLIFGGVFVMVLGIAVCARAGRLRERSGPTGNYAGAILMAVICGVLAPMINYAFAFGQPIAEAAIRLGTTPEAAGYAVWPVGLLGGFVPNLVYSIYLLTRNRTWKNFRGSWRPDVLLGVAMGALWMGAVATYGVSSVYLGELGTSLGWGLFQIFMIMTANLSGVLTGEWSDAIPAARRRLAAGLCLLAAATVLIAAGNG
jgi:L-rhamnose-H+ transport protein